jgi:hypothetical protein
VEAKLDQHYAGTDNPRLFLNNISHFKLRFMHASDRTAYRDLPPRGVLSG